MGLQALIASVAGDVWRNWGCIALWPWPATVYRYPHGKMTWGDYRAFTRLLKPGDFLLTRSEPYFLSNWAISGTALKHLAVYTGAIKGYRNEETGFIERPSSLGLHYSHTGLSGPNVYERSVTHAISEGVVCQDLGELLFHSDYVVAVRPWLDEDQQGVIVETAIGKVGQDYDFGFKETPDSLYCTELGAHVCKRSAITCPERVKINTSLWGVFLPIPYFKTPVTLADYFLRFPIVYASRSCDDVNFQRKSRVRELLRTAILKGAHASGRV